MTLLTVGCLAFLITHLGVSSTQLRGVLINAMGQRGYLGLYSVMAAVTLGLMIYGYKQVPHADFIWAPSVPLYAFAQVVMPFALIFVVSGVLAPNPTSVMQDGAVTRDLAGILKITRHPVQWGILLWAIAHLAANGDVASIVFFGTFAVLSGGGMVAMDAKFRQREQPEWQAFFAKTSYWPFGAVIAGRNSFSIGGRDWIGIGVGLVLAVLLYVFHTWVAGVPLI